MTPPRTDDWQTATQCKEMTVTTTDTTNALGPGPEVESAGQAWHGVLAMVGIATSDGRIFDELAWRELPLSLLWQPSNEDGHGGAVVVGRIDRIVRDGSALWGYGTFDTVGENAREVIRLIRGGFLRGVSVDAAALDMEAGEDGLMHFHGEIGAATIVAFPAFADAEIALDDNEASVASAHGAWVDGVWVPALMPSVHTVDLGVGVGLVAASTPDAHPRSWFTRADMTKREPLHVEADGRVWGHVAGWGECHTGNPNSCVQPPRSQRDYAYFLAGHVLCDDGTQVRTGPIVLAADHAALRGITWIQAKDHYANSALAAADVTCGEDEFGIWVAGAARPGTPPELVHALRASPPSGDWRPIGGSLEMIAILSVSTAGYPALAASFEDGELTALVASGNVVEVACGCGAGATSLDVLIDVLRPIADRFAREQQAADAAVREHRARELAASVDRAHRAARAAELDGVLASRTAMP